MMQAYEYRVIPAPKRGLKGKGVGSATEDRFAFALQEAMNTLGAAGWDYVRADTLPCEERQGLTGRTTAYHNLLVFRRALPLVAQAAPPQIFAPPAIGAVGGTAPVPAFLSAPGPAFLSAPMPAAGAGPALQLANPLPPAPPLGPADRVAAE